MLDSIITEAHAETYQEMLDEASGISDRRNKDNLRMGDILIAACGPAVIGRPSNDNMSILGDFMDATGFKLRTLQSYRQVAEFYTESMREWCKMEHVFYTWMRDAMVKAFRMFPLDDLEGQQMAAMDYLRKWLFEKYDTEQVSKSVPARKGEEVRLSELQLSPDTVFTKTVREDGKIILKAIL